MALFNRYDVKDNSLESSFWEYNDKYCNPKDYMTTKEECEKYLKELITANKENKELNENRRKRWMKAIYIGVAVFCMTILAPLCLWLINDNSTWVVVLSYFIFNGTIAISLWIIESTDRYFSKNTIYWDALYPTVNQNIEKLFDDYLWKLKLVREADSKEETERKRILKMVERMSHPELGSFLELVENELKSPSEEYVFGDVKFGMTPEEIYNTKAFCGLSLGENKEIYLGFRGQHLGQLFMLTGALITFQLDDNELSKMLMSIDFHCEDSMLDRVGKCCEQLSVYYGKPRILHERYYKKTHSYLPDKAEFRVGKKCVLLHIEKLILMLEFFQKDVLDPVPHYRPINNMSEEELDRLFSGY